MDVWEKAQRLADLINDRNTDDSSYARFELYTRVIKRELLREFARLRGWKASKVQIVKVSSRLGQTGIFDCPNPPIDNPYVFRDENRRLVLVTHMYEVDKVANQKTADEFGLTVEYPTDFPSWWYPGQTTMVIWRKARVNG